MIQIKTRNIEIDVSAVNPTLIIKIDILHTRQIEAPLSISGNLMVSGKTVSFLSEHYFNGSDYYGIKLFSKEAKDKIYNQNNERNYYAILTASLSPKAIEYIEAAREKDSEKSVTFVINTIIKYIESPTDTSFNDYLIKIHVRSESEYFTIKQSDWIRKYVPFLGIGNFMLLEFEIPEKHKISANWTELYDRLSYRLKEMEEAIRNGDWHKTMGYGRQFYENLKFNTKLSKGKEFKDSLKELFESDRHSSAGFENFYDGIVSFFSYISKFIHDTGKTGDLNPIPLTTKEDAYFVYTMALGILNIIGKKLAKNN